MDLLIDTEGNVRCLYLEALDLGQLGHLQIARASHVEPDAAGRWWADLSPLGGESLGPFLHRSHALNAEQAWLEKNWLNPARTS